MAVIASIIIPVIGTILLSILSSIPEIFAGYGEACSKWVESFKQELAGNGTASALGRLAVVVCLIIKLPFLLLFVGIPYVKWWSSPLTIAILAVAGAIFGAFGSYFENRSKTKRAAKTAGTGSPTQTEAIPASKPHDVIPASAAKGSPERPAPSFDAEIRALSTLRSDGVISEDEFNAKKRVILGI